jgi:hypothetical protein
MSTKSNLAEDPVALRGDNMPPAKRLPRVAELSDIEECPVAPSVERPLGHVRVVEAAEAVNGSPGRRNRIGLLLAVVVVTIGPCGALLVALGSPHLGPNTPADAVPVAAAAPALQLVLDDQSSPLPDFLPAQLPVTVTDDLVDAPVDHAPTRIISKSLMSNRHSPRHTVIASDRPVTRIATDYQHGGPYARTGNGPGNFFSGDR